MSSPPGSFLRAAGILHLPDGVKSEDLIRQIRGDDTDWRQLAQEAGKVLAWHMRTGCLTERDCADQAACEKRIGELLAALKAAGLEV